MEIVIYKGRDRLFSRDAFARKKILPKQKQIWQISTFSLRELLFYGMNMLMRRFFKYLVYGFDCVYPFRDTDSNFF